jgi:hypothetical protein
MPSVSFWSAFEFVANDGSTVGDGSLDVPVYVPATGTAPPYSNALTLAQNASGTLWDAANGPTDFTFLEIKSDVGDMANGLVMIELTVDENNTFGTRYQTFALLAGVPFVLASSAAYANYSANFGGGTLSKIQRIRCKNLNSSAANVSIRSVP